MSTTTDQPTSGIDSPDHPLPEGSDQVAASKDIAPDEIAASLETTGKDETSALTAPQATAEKPPSIPPIAVDERAYQQYQQLADAVLDSAEVASRASETALAYSRELQRTIQELNTMTEAYERKLKISFTVGSALMFVGLVFFLVMGVRIASRISQLDATVMAVGKRVVDLNAGLESLGGVNESLQQLAEKQSNLSEVQNQMGSQIEASLKQSETLTQKLPTEAAKKIAETNDGVVKSIQGINGRLQAQATAVQSLGSEMKALKGSIANVDSLKRDVEALVTLQKERYLEALQKRNTTTVKEQRSLQYPRYQQPKTDGLQAAGSAQD